MSKTYTIKLFVESSYSRNYLKKTLFLPDNSYFRLIIKSVLNYLKLKHRFQIGIKIVDEQTGIDLNKTLRNENKSTNVISIDYDVGSVVSGLYMGDMIFCLPVLIDEQQRYNLNWQGYWAHLTVHAMLHILGYDHLTDEQEKAMQKIEAIALKSLGFNKMYLANSLSGFAN